MSYLLTVFFFVWILNLVGLTPLGVNVTGNIAVTFCFSINYFVSLLSFREKRLLEAYILDARSTGSHENNFSSNRIIRSIHKAFCLNDSFVCKHYWLDTLYNEFIGYDIYVQIG